MITLTYKKLTRWKKLKPQHSILYSLILSFCFSSTSQGAESNELSSLINTYRTNNEKRILEDFVSLLKLPNVASNLSDMQVNADHIEAELLERGFKVTQLRESGSPYVFAELNSAHATETLLLYAHYDGQPVIEENWEYPPFSPTLLDAPIEDGGQPIDIDTLSSAIDPESRLYARSAGDDKMPIIALLHVIDALNEESVPLSVNLKLLFDGEEERGSPTLGAVIDANPDLFEADLILFCDAPMHQSRRAQLVFGVRGGRTLDMTTYGASRPLHSGHYGNWAPNPVMNLAYLLTSMRDEEGNILIEYYYDDVEQLSESEYSAIAAMPDVTELLKDELSIHTPEGNGRRLEELITLPAFNVRGFEAGGVGAQGRNIILSKATASINLRLVPNQTPARVRELIESHIRNENYFIVYDEPTSEELRNNEKVIKLDWRGEGGPGLRTSMDNPMSRRLIDIMDSITADLVLTPSMGGGLPLNAFDSRMDTPIIVLPLANHDNNQHAENENLRIQNFWDAMLVYGVILASFGEQPAN